MADYRRSWLRGRAGWILIVVAMTLVVVFAAFVVMGSIFFPLGTGPEEAAQESATSGPGLNTTNRTQTPAS